jgi:Fe-S-cluster containining protein
MLRLLKSIRFTVPPRHDLKDKTRALRKVFKAVDRQTTQFQKAAGIHCERGCGRCCENPNVTTTVLEMVPLALELWEKGEAERWLQKAEADSGGKCLFYKPAPFQEGKGRCSIYSLRPLICRLFGFSAMHDKHGKPVFVTCPTIKKMFPGAYDNIQKRIQEGLAIPQMSDFSQGVRNIDIELGTQQIPINWAIKLALEYVGMKMEYTLQEKESLKINAGDHPGTESTRFY